MCRRFRTPSGKTMDKLTSYRPIIERILNEYLEFMADDEQVEVVSLIDKKEENYLLLEMGWQYPRRIYNVIFHIRLKQGKIWVEQDWTREGIAHQLVATGVPVDVIEFSYQPPEMRKAAQLQLA